jgi:hypothetical protein
MPKRTDLATGTINGNTPLRVELIEPNRGKRPVIAIDWPPTPTVCEPAQLDAVVCRSNENPGEQCCHARRHPSTTEDLAAQEKTPRMSAGAFLIPCEQASCRRCGYLSPLRNLIPRS